MNKNRQSYDNLSAQLPPWANIQELITPIAVMAQGAENLRDDRDWDGAKSLLSEMLQTVKVLGRLEKEGTMRKESADVLIEIFGEWFLKEITLFQREKQQIEQNLPGNKDANTAAPTESPTRLSMQEIARLPVAERHKILAPYIAATAEDFLKDPELTEFSVLDGEDWELENE